MTPDIFDFILTELGLDACADPGATVAAGQPTSPRTVVHLPTSPDKQATDRRHCQNKLAAPRDMRNVVIADPAQNQIVVRDREEASRRSHGGQ